MKQVVHTQAPPSSTPTDMDVNATLNHLISTQNGLGTDVVQPSTVVNQLGKLNHGLLLLAGEHGGFEVKGERTVVGASPGSVIRKQLVVTGSAVISGATLICSDNTPAVLIKDGGRLILRDCHIVKADTTQTAAADSYIKMATGSYACLVGCFFYGTQANIGTLVYNEDAGNPTRGAVIGCVNLTDVAATPFLNIAPANVVGVVP